MLNVVVDFVSITAGVGDNSIQFQVLVHNTANDQLYVCADTPVGPAINVYLQLLLRCPWHKRFYFFLEQSRYTNGLVSVANITLPDFIGLLCNTGIVVSIMFSLTFIAVLDQQRGQAFFIIADSGSALILSINLQDNSFVGFDVLVLDEPPVVGLSIHFHVNQYQNPYHFLLLLK